MAIKKWPTLKMVTGVRSFHELVSFYRRFVKDFNTTIALLTEIIKKTLGFKWENKQEKAFKLLQEKLVSSPYLFCLTL